MADYISQAMSAGVPLERIERFLAENPGDEHRLLAALWEEANPGPDDAEREIIRTAYGYNQGGVTTRPFEAPPPYIPQFTAQPLVQVTRPAAPLMMDRNLIANVPTPSPGEDPISGESSGIGTEGWRDVLGTIVGSLPFPGAPIVGGIIGGFPDFGGGGGGTPVQRPGLPMPGGGLPAPRPTPAPAPPRPVGGGATAAARMGRVTAKLSPYMNPKTGRNIPWSKIAKIATAAAGLGISVDQFIGTYGVPRDSPTMNPLNPRALRRAMNRTEKFAGFCKRAMRFTEKYKAPRKRGRKKC